jgi:hypothetical protein
VRNIIEVANFLDGYARNRGLPERLRWTPHKCIDADEGQIHRRVRAVLIGAADAADWSTESFQALVKWSVDHGVVTPTELVDIKRNHGFEVAS